MSSDIILNDDNTVTVQGCDLRLDAADRRKNQTPFRRALVNDSNDGLTLNWGDDYPGGVKICGDVTLPSGNVTLPNGKLNVKEGLTVQGWDLRLDAPDRRKNQTPFRRALVHDSNDGLTLNWGTDYPGGVTICGDVALPSGKLNVTQSLFKIEFPPLQGAEYAGRLALGPSGPEGKPMLACDVEYFRLRNPKVKNFACKALTHTEQDALVINQGGAYKGGLRLKAR